MCKRGLETALKRILSPGPYDRVVTSLEEDNMCRKWNELLKKHAQKRVIKTKMPSQSVP